MANIVIKAIFFIERNVWFTRYRNRWASGNRNGNNQLKKLQKVVVIHRPCRNSYAYLSGACTKPRFLHHHFAITFPFSGKGSWPWNGTKHIPITLLQTVKWSGCFVMPE